jgi:hypothetical protein
MKTFHSFELKWYGFLTLVLLTCIELIMFDERYCTKRNNNYLSSKSKMKDSLYLMFFLFVKKSI